MTSARIKVIERASSFARSQLWYSRASTSFQVGSFRPTTVEGRVSTRCWCSAVFEHVTSMLTNAASLLRATAPGVVDALEVSVAFTLSSFCAAHGMARFDNPLKGIYKFRMA